MKRSTRRSTEEGRKRLTRISTKFLPRTHTPPAFYLTLHVAFNNLPLNTTRPLLSSAQPLPHPTRSPVRPALPSDPLSRPGLSTPSLAVLPSPPSLHNLMPTGPLAHIIHIASRIAWVARTYARLTRISRSMPLIR
ncbi:hypothetical protein HETIRDRAFT_450292 [Heterobasidion irregulare TC 32-1]|uniref:Uncharacterized protein n=1 Tax=Heterobasidion irregulare (strain TC 32-1) TaxID=747525 RepID=W4JQ14_HETIT|nr:uncharacterized protein HETIRDRAFT_450292 [Heterobasidion irregulare TC 32-1]XP_009553019.1 uncharacterized protein HETIRDRAFT_456168 [Heterobasidion irregulare TC 32-1]ETW75623.1 hypothetical protein HETIRDRAFT_456168 [Heterobasidion irregulare TC 32-1]ETW82389.1 hypothetical protein HETIRDRAFT_450292 [Heterobasidion irregulare TC 32-1]